MNVRYPLCYEQLMLTSFSYSKFFSFPKATLQTAQSASSRSKPVHESAENLQLQGIVFFKVKDHFLVYTIIFLSCINQSQI